jgi:protein TonB
LKQKKIITISKKFAILFLIQLFVGASLQAQAHVKLKSPYLYLYTDKLPRYPGGVGKLKLLLRENLKWPVNGPDAQGTVLLSFIVSSDGTISDIKVEKSLTKEFDDEAKKVVSLMPKWIPGKIGNNNVDVKMYFPVDFFLNE